MPEGVEVKISAELIKPLVVGKYIRKTILGSNGRYSGTEPEGHKEFTDSYRDSSGNITIINNLKTTDVKTKGKLMYWSFDNGWHMMCTFGMTGQWSPEPGKHVCFQISMFDNDPGHAVSNVYFNDPRHFGTLKFVKTFAQMNEKISSLGWDPLQDSLKDIKTPTTTIKGWDVYLNHMIMKSNKPIGQLLMDQSLFAGVGNYIRAEALYQAKMSPWRLGNQLTKDDLNGLYEAIVSVMKESYSHQGATILTYKDAYGAEGKYSSCFKVYGQKKDPLGNLIKKENTPDKRTIHWCPTVQI